MPTSDGQHSHGTTFAFAALFLVVPVAVLVTLARRAHSTPREDYIRAVNMAERPSLADVSHSLATVKFGEEVTVVTWAKHDSVKDYRDKNETPEFKDTWVTIAARLKRFCRDYVRDNSSDGALLTTRLEQRLGLPPDSGFDTFIEFNIRPTDVTQLFRPCIDPAPSSNTCRPAFSSYCTNWTSRPEDCLPRTAPELTAELRLLDAQAPGTGNASSAPAQFAALASHVRNQFWFLNAYYNRFALPEPYPWTSLGYTFDWASEPGSDNFAQFGESEFVVPPKVPIKFVGATDTLAYCTQ